MLRPRCRDLRLGRLEKFVQNLAAERQVNTSERRHDVGREESGAALSSTNQSCMLPNSSLGSAPIVIHNLFCCFDGYKAGEPDIVAGAGTDLHKNVCVCVCQPLFQRVLPFFIFLLCKQGDTAPDCRPCLTKLCNLVGYPAWPAGRTCSFSHKLLPYSSTV